MFVVALLLAAATAHAGEVARGDLAIVGLGLEVDRNPVITAVDVPSYVQTFFGGKVGAEAPAAPGLSALGDLTGPGIDAPITLSAIPGQKFAIPALHDKGEFVLQNIRLVGANGEFLQQAVPSFATVQVSDILQTRVKVRQLTPEELRERGIHIDDRNFEVYGRATASLHPDGTRTESHYDAMGNPTIVQSRDSGGTLLAETRPSFTAAGRLQSIATKVDDTQTRASTIRWDGGGRTTFSATHERASKQLFDDAGRLKNAAAGFLDGENIVAFSSFTATSHESTLVKAGQLLEKGSATPVVTSMAYDTMANVTSRKIGDLLWSQKFDEDSNLKSSLQPERPPAAEFTYHSDARGNLTDEMKPGAASFKRQYEASGAASAYDDPVDPPTTTQNDRIGRPLVRSYADNTSETFTWDGSRLRSTKDRQGREFHYDYNDKGQLFRIRNATVTLEELDYHASGYLAKWRTRDAELSYDDYNMEGRPRKTKQTRYAQHSGFGSRNVLDVYSQEHEWNVHGERKAWTMPVPPAFSAPGWTARVEEAYDAAGNVDSILRTRTGATSATPLMTADYRNAGRPAIRTVHTGAASIVRQYGYDADTGQLNDLAVSAGGYVVAGARIEYDGLLVKRASLHGVSDGQRANEYSYDLRDRVETSKAAREAGAPPSIERIDPADFREALERSHADPAALPSLMFGRQVGHKIASLTRGSETRAFDYAGGAERVSDGRFRYEFDARGRLISATEQLQAANPLSLSLRRIHYDYSAEGRVVGRRAEYARLSSSSSPPLPADWKLEDRAAILNADGVPADTTFVWDPISDRLAAIYTAGGTTLLRQILHGGSGYDDPIEVAVSDGASGVGRLYPVFDEAGAGTLQVILNDAGEVVSRTVAEGAYGEDEFALAGAAVDRIAITAKKSSSGAIESVEVTIRATETLDAATVATGARLCVVDETGAVVRSASATPSLIDNESATLRWTLTGTEWTTLTTPSAGQPHSLSIAVTNTLRAAAWSDENGILPPTATSLRCSAALPVESREPLSALTTWLDAIAPSSGSTTTLFAAPALSALAGATPKAPRLIVAAGFQALPFAEPITGLIYARARWYDPSTGSFLSPDPLGYRDSSNLYAFAGGDPVNGRDPTGELCDGRNSDGLWAWAKRCHADITGAELDAAKQIVTNPLKSAGRAVAGVFGTGKFIAKTVVGAIEIAGDTALMQMGSEDAARRHGQRIGGVIDAVQHPVEAVVNAHNRAADRILEHERKGEWFRGSIEAGEIGAADAAAVVGAVEGGLSMAQAGGRALTRATSFIDDFSINIGPGSNFIPGAVDAAVDAVLYARPKSFRKAPSKAADAAAPTNEFGQMVCPTCLEVIPAKISVMTKHGPRTRRGWDYDHFGRTWAQRVLDMRRWMTAPTRGQVIDEFNRDIRVQCPGCNQGHQFEGW